MPVVANMTMQVEKKKKKKKKIEEKKGACHRIFQLYSSLKRSKDKKIINAVRKG
jgi:uncharacterized protein YjhX (UPF0386 family)